MGQITTSPIKLDRTSRVRTRDLRRGLRAEPAVYVRVGGALDGTDVADLAERARIRICVGCVTNVGLSVDDHLVGEPVRRDLGRAEEDR